MGEPARLVDAVPSEEAAALAQNCQNIRFSQTELLESLEDVRTVDIRMEDGSRADRYVYQMRNTDKGKWLFIAQGLPAENPDIPHVHTLSIRIPGCYHVELYDTLSGTHASLAAEHRQGETVIRQGMADHDSLLLRLTPCETGKEMKNPMEEKSYIRVQKPAESVPVTLSEPNVLLLDMAEASLDSEEWAEKEEVLRIDNILRTRLGYPLKVEAFAQPWTRKKAPAEHMLSLRYTIDSAVEVDNVHLAIELAEDMVISWKDRKSVV